MMTIISGQPGAESARSEFIGKVIMGQGFEKRDCYRVVRSHSGNGCLIPFEGMLVTAMHSVQGALARTARKTAT